MFIFRVDQKTKMAAKKIPVEKYFCKLKIQNGCNYR